MKFYHFQCRQVCAIKHQDRKKYQLTILTFKFLEKNNLGAPWTVSSLESIPKNYPAIYKPRNLSGSRSVMIVETEEEDDFESGKLFACVTPYTVGKTSGIMGYLTGALLGSMGTHAGKLSDRVIKL